MSRQLGPGPGAYLLPTTVGYEKHDVRKNRRPQYSFGVKTTLGKKVLGPGPAGYNPDKLTRYGRPGIPAYSLGHRTQVGRKDIGPGPAGYNLAEYKPNQPPAFSLSGRHYLPNKNLNPGPNAYLYSVDQVKPGIPAYSMGVRTGLKVKLKSPGPAAYGAGDLDLILRRSPTYTMGVRTGLRNKNVGPGPNNYNLAGYRPGDGTPAYSFGVRHSPYAPPMVVDCDN